MPTNTTRVKLGRDQVLTLDGAVLEGVRELDFEITASTLDLTSWVDAFSSTLVVSADVSIRVLIYWKEDYDRIAAKHMKHPPQSMALGISNVGTYRVVPETIRVQQPIAGVVSWEVTFKSFGY